MNFICLDNMTVITLSSGLIDNEAYFDNLHLSNHERMRKLANNFEIILSLKSRSQTRNRQSKHVPPPSTAIYRT